MVRARPRFDDAENRTSAIAQRSADDDGGSDFRLGARHCRNADSLVRRESNVGPRQFCDLVYLLLGLHPDEDFDVVEHGCRYSSGRASSFDRLDCGRRRDDRLVRLGLDVHCRFVAVPTFHVDRLALSRTIHASRLQDAHAS